MLILLDMELNHWLSGGTEIWIRTDSVWQVGENGQPTSPDRKPSLHFVSNAFCIQFL